MSEYYWELKYGSYKDLKSVMIPPASVDQVKHRWDGGEPIHLTGRASIPANQIREFEITDKLFTTQPLLESVAQAFNEPIVNEDGSVAARWVKKTVTQDKWNRMLSNIPGYRALDGDNGMMTIAFKLAIHDIDPTKTPYCTEEEVRQLER